MTVRSFIVALVLAVIGAGAWLALRGGLWLVVQACVADARLTGSPFPCLLATTTGGEERGYVVLRKPFGPPDTILAPTRRVAGVEDPWLRSGEAPNYFDAAWRARPLLRGADGETPAPRRFALAVNPAHIRSQDQFHIHLGCLSPAVERWLGPATANLPVRTWTRLDAVMTGAAFWAFRTGRSDLSGVDPLKLAAEGLAGRTQAPSRLALLIAQIPGGDGEIVALATSASASGSLGGASAESLLDLACAAEPGAARGTDAPSR